MAGIIAMKANNRNCGVGVAPQAKFGGKSWNEYRTIPIIVTYSLFHLTLWI